MTNLVHNTAETLVSLGFERAPEWDYQHKRYPDGAIISITEHYRLVLPHGVFRAYEERSNGPLYVRLAKVNEAGQQLDKWGYSDCCSQGSVARKIAAPASPLYH
jgi:hypothetical protein